jgi:formylmethanofuran dehydrogenase subunit A
MDRDFRTEALRAVNPRAIARTRLPDLDREYSLYEIAIITRAAPARLLGLTQKGHLGPGADADIAIYAPDGDWEKTFARPRFVIKAGAAIVEEGEIRHEVDGRSLYVEPEWDAAIVPEIRKWFADFYTIEFENFPVGLEYLPRPERVDTLRPA